MHQHRRVRIHGGFGDTRRSFDMQRFEALAVALALYPDEIDNGIRVLDRSGDHFRVRHVTFDDLDLPHLAERLEIIRGFGPAHGHADSIPRFGQRLHGMAANKAGSAKDRDQGIFHRRPPSILELY